MATMHRYDRNKNCISAVEQEGLAQARVCVIGCGGLGGYNIEMLARVGIGHISAIDGDVFDVSNLNRQLYSDMDVIGQGKADVAARRVHAFNPDITITPIKAFVSEENAKELLENHDIIVDSLDNIETRKTVAKLCQQLNIPFVYGAIAGWYGQVSTIMPGDQTLEKLYRSKVKSGAEKKLGNPSFTPALIASMQVAEVVKILTQKGDILQNKVLFIDTLDHEYWVQPLLE
jgi:molybdopterin/thiamine biosynthesis adenylyltransferase